MTNKSYEWVAVVTPPVAPGDPWRALLVRLTPHSDGRPGHHWWPLTPLTRRRPIAGVRLLHDDEGNLAAVEVTVKTRKRFASLLESAGLVFDALGSPTLFSVPEGHAHWGGWVWPFTTVDAGFPFSKGAALTDGIIMKRVAELEVGDIIKFEDTGVIIASIERHPVDGDSPPKPAPVTLVLESVDGTQVDVTVWENDEYEVAPPLEVVEESP